MAVKTKYDLLIEWLRNNKAYQRIINVDRLNSQFEEHLLTKGITDKKHRKGRNKYPWHTLEVNEFVVVTDTKPDALSASINKYNEKYGFEKRFTTRQLGPTDLVLWRVK